MAGDGDNACCRWPCQSELGPVAGTLAQQALREPLSASPQALAPRAPAVVVEAHNWAQCVITIRQAAWTPLLCNTIGISATHCFAAMTVVRQLVTERGQWPVAQARRIRRSVRLGRTPARPQRRYRAGRSVRCRMLPEAPSGHLGRPPGRRLLAQTRAGTRRWPFRRKLRSRGDPPRRVAALPTEVPVALFDGASVGGAGGEVA